MCVQQRPQLGDQISTMEKVVTQYKGGWPARGIWLQWDGLGQAIGAGLHGVLDGHAPGTAIAEQGVGRLPDREVW